MDFSLTVFKNKFDNKTDKSIKFNSFDELETLFYKLSKIKYKKKEDAPLISPASYLNGTKRRNVNVVDWGGWAAIDVDDGKFSGDTEDAVRSHLKDTRFICYSTASSTIKLPKFRVVVQLDKRITGENIRHFWFSLVNSTNLSADIQCKDYSRMYYVPGDYASSSNNFIFSGGSKPIDTYDLMERFPAPKAKSNNFIDNLPEEIQKEIINHRKQQMENNSISWNSYRDCPFWPKKLASEYMSISDSGWYYKMYQIMCGIASNAIRMKYPISAGEISLLCAEFDQDNGYWYKNRPLEMEANRAIEFAYRNM